MSSAIRSVSIVLPFLASAILAGPKIKFDATTIDCGVAIEGKTEKISAVFSFSNTGDAALHLSGVRPGCGCTVVKYDTTILPGKTSKIASEVNIKGYRSGPISKGVTVTSNATDQPTVQLTITATVQAAIDVSESFLSLAPNGADSLRRVYLSSRKSDLSVQSVAFKSADTSAGLGWKNPAMEVKYVWTRMDSTRADGGRVYKLDLRAPGAARAATGEFIIRTNHPDKPEISIRGRVGA